MVNIRLTESELLATIQVINDAIGEYGSRGHYDSEFSKLNDFRNFLIDVQELRIGRKGKEFFFFKLHANFQCDILSTFLFDLVYFNAEYYSSHCIMGLKTLCIATRSDPLEVITFSDYTRTLPGAFVSFQIRSSRNLRFSKKKDIRVIFALAM